MNKYKIRIIIFLLTILCVNVYGQTKKYAFNFQKTGQGNQTIIFIPGFACSGEVWDETVKIFKNKYICYTLTMAGFAGAQPQTTPSFNNWEESIADFIKDNKIDHPIVVGHSMGGGLALALASDYPDLVGKIIVVDALPCLLALSNDSFQSKKDNDCSKVINQMKAMTEDQFYQMQKAGVKSLLADSAMQEKVINWSLKSDRSTFAKMYCDFSNTDLRDKIKNITCPALVLLEPYFSNIKPRIEAQYKNLKSVKLQYATRGLHFIMYDDKQWYFNQLTNFLMNK